MQTITIEVYSFKELIALEKENKISSQTVQKVREKLMEWNTDRELINETICVQDWMPVLERVGFIEPDIFWSGFSKQGDGACFTSKCDIPKLINWFTKPVEKSQVYSENNLQWLAYKLDGQTINPKFKNLLRRKDIMSLEVKRNNQRYCHEECSHLVHEFELNDKNQLVYKNFLDFELAVEELRLQICKAIYKDLYDQNKALSEDENLIEYDENNEYQWDKYGRRFLLY